MKLLILTSLILAFAPLNGATRTLANLISNTGSQIQIPYNPVVGPGTMASLSYDNPKMVLTLINGIFACLGIYMIFSDNILMYSQYSFAVP
jgi:hypothetical protein